MNSHRHSDFIVNVKTILPTNLNEQEQQRHFEYPKILNVKNNSLDTSIVKIRHFYDIFRLGEMLGFPTTQTSLKSSSNKLSCGIKAWCIVLTIIKTVLFALLCNFYYLLLPTSTLKYATYLYYISGTISLWLLIIRRISICTAIRNLSVLATKVNARAQISSTTIKIEILILMVFGVVLAYIQTKYYFYEEWNNCLKVLKSSSFKNSDYVYECTWIVLFSIIFLQGCNSVTCFFVLLICSHSYYTLYQIIDHYSRDLKHALSKNGLTRQMVSCFLSRFVDVAKCVAEVDNALSANAFSLIGMVISNVLCTISVMLARSEKYSSSTVDEYVIWTYIINLTVFFVLTSSGAKVYRSGVQLKQVIIECSEPLSERSPDWKTFAKFNLLVENVRGSSFEVTCWEMFAINKSFTLNVFGLVFTYGILMYQLEDLRTEF